jgi:hypothetical protein
MARERYDPMTGTWSRSSSERFAEESATKRKKKKTKGKKKSSKKRKSGKRKSTKRSGTVARKKKSVGAGTKRRSGKKRGGKRRGSGKRRNNARAVVRVKRRPKKRRGGRLTSKSIVGQLVQAGKDGAWTVAGDVAANMAQIMSGQTGIAGIGVQVAGGFAAGYVVSKYVDRDAGRFVMAGAAAGIVRKLITDNVITSLPAGTLKTNLTAALQGYPHTEYAAQINGYTNVEASQDAMGLPTGYGVGQMGM